MKNGIRFDLEYETMPWHRVDAVVFDIGNILIRYAPNDFLKQLFPGDEQKQRDMMARVYRLYLLSNYPREGYRRMREKFADEFGDLFDGGVISSACHFVKPEKEIYEKLIADCALTPERTLFIDDTLPNVEGAMKLGINGFHMHEKGMMDRFFL